MSAKLPNLWDDKRAKRMSGPEKLKYRSNLLGSDLRVTNFGGGNTSSKLRSSTPSKVFTEVLSMKTKWLGICRTVHLI